MRPSIHWQASLLKSFLGGETAVALPFALSVDVTNRCNLHGLHCRRPSPLLAAEGRAPAPDFYQLADRSGSS